MDNENQSQALSNPQQNLSVKILRLLSHNKYIVIVIAILGITSFGSTAYLLTANDNKESAPKANNEEKKVEVPSPTAVPAKSISQLIDTPTPTLTIIVDPIASWSAFLSAKYGYSLKYPPDWTAKITSQQDPKILEYVVFNPKDATVSGTLSITVSYGTRTYQEALALDPQKGETVKIATVSATKKNQKDSDGTTSISVIVPVATTSSMIINAKDKYKSILDKILTTVKLK